MSTPFSGALGVVRVQIAPEVYVSAVPQLARQAYQQVLTVCALVEKLGDSAQFFAFDVGPNEPECMIRARSVLTVDVVLTEDPS